ncbi:Aldehyde/histidinol dehydrogenase [Xylogone sp. PMI_703]|nr:Aldehyde/histidinol dehydrogenase [Xylogone sp. PMI_703]
MPLLSKNDPLPNQLFINNEYVPSKSDKTIALYSPVDQRLISNNVPIGNEADVNSAVAAAEAAYPAWKKLPPVQRRDILLKFADLVMENAEVLTHLTSLNLGSPTTSVIESWLVAELFRYYAGWIDKVAGESFPQEDGFMRIVRYEPIGVTAGIVPWNGPLGFVGFKAAPSLAAGNCFILKSSEKTPLVTLALGKLIVEAGFPPGVFQVISGDGSTGALIASHMKIRKVSFTGSVSTGKKVQEAAAKSNLKLVTLELGGKSPVIIFDDCDVEKSAAAAVDAITINSGQACIAASRVYVQEGIYGKFIVAYKAIMEERAKGFGDPTDPSTTHGPLVDELQFKRVSGFVERGASQGKVLTGGASMNRAGYFMLPTAFIDVPANAEINTEEIFGPVSVIHKFTAEDEVIKLANDSEFGLMARVFTNDITRALRVASELESGMVGINCMSLFMLNAPFGGMKQSGTGREMGKAGILAWLETKTMIIKMV